MQSLIIYLISLGIVIYGFSLWIMDRAPIGLVAIFFGSMIISAWAQSAEKS